MSHAAEPFVKALSILVVDDDETIAAVVRATVGPNDTCEYCADGAAGLARARAKRFDLIVIDQLIPGMSGLELLKQLAAEGIRTRVIMLTGGPEFYTDTAFIMKCARAGASAFLTKPFTRQWLDVAIREAVLLEPTLDTRGDTDVLTAALERAEAAQEAQREENLKLVQANEALAAENADLDKRLRRKSAVASDLLAKTVYAVLVLALLGFMIRHGVEVTTGVLLCMALFLMLLLIPIGALDTIKTKLFEVTTRPDDRDKPAA